MDDRKKSNIWEWLPLLSFLIAICAFTFQVTVLYPWHLELSRDFAKLAARIHR